MGKKARSSRKNYRAMASGKEAIEEVHLDNVDNSIVGNKDDLEKSTVDLKLSLEEEERQLDIQLQQKRIERKKQELEALSVEEVSAPTAAASHLSSSKEELDPTLKSMAADKDLSAAMAILEAAHLKDTLAANEEKSRNTTGKCEYIQYIPDYVKLPKSSCRDREQSLGRGLVLKDKNKVTLESVTEAQWAGASIRILQSNLDKMDHEEIDAYLEYMVQISDYLQVCKPPSVMLLDEEHRIRVARGGRRWDEIDQMKAFFYLEKKEDDADDKKKAPSSYGKKSNVNGEKQLCYDFNKEEGCHRSYCRFAHICSICKSSAHPRHKHNAPPRFRDPNSQA